MWIELATSFFLLFFLSSAISVVDALDGVGWGEDYFYIIRCLFRFYCFFMGCMASLNGAQPVHDLKKLRKDKKV